MQKLRIVVPTVFATGALLLTGCSSSDSGRGTPAAGTSSSPSASPSPSPTDGKQLVQDSTDALSAADSFHIEGTIESGGSQIALDITYGADDVAMGTLDAGDEGKIELRRVADGTVYANGSAEYYAQDSDNTGPDLSSIADKWVVVDDSAPDVLSSAVSLLDRDDFASSLEPDSGDDETYELSGPEDVDGQSAYLVTDKSGSTFAIAAEGDPLPIKFTNDEADGGNGEIGFDGYGDDVTVDAPDDGEIVPIPA